ncbi:MAG TPA: alpha/beta hydrolase [Thermoanaerobaculia bacterium]|nr:alpha/beta hydrolase [Thermoanaerobaculia bacterium]
MGRRGRNRTLGDALALPLMIGGAILLGADLARRIYRQSQIFEPSPDPVISWNPADYGIPAGAAEEQWIETPDGETLHAWYCRAEKPVASGIFCHGNKGNLTISADVIPHLLNAGFNVLFFDYRGFGRSTGRVSYDGVISDGVTAARHHERIRPKHLPSILYGFSLGGAVAAQVIRRHPFDALILQSTFTSLTGVTRALYPRIPLHLLAGDLFNTLSVIRRLEVPLLILHGTSDEVCPHSMAHEIYAACKTPKRMHVVEGGLHKDLYVRDADALIWAISQFIADLPHVQRRQSVEEAPLGEQWRDAAWRVVRRALRRRGSSVIASPAR